MFLKTNNNLHKSKRKERLLSILTHLGLDNKHLIDDTSDSMMIQNLFLRYKIFF